MTATSIVFFLIGAVFLWGGLAVTISIAVKNESKK
ncbi:MetS family NSS transporter small subunit [Ruminiclostridium josui]|nr:MetS family NSS transporter small subunit [Ruminiclostridium josui]